jgi:nucleotide-binding universal stress UspA family protein
MTSIERTIIIGVDYSDFCIPAVDEALLVASASGAARLVPLLALPGTLPAEPSGTAEMTAEVVERAKENLVRLVETRARTLGLTPPLIEPSVSFGPPAEALLTEARKRKADMIAVGTHGRRGLEHLFLGSVAEEVMRQAPCSVLVARTRLAEMLAATQLDETTERWATGDKDTDAETGLDATAEEPQMLTEPYVEADRVVLHLLDVPSNQVFVCSFEDARTVSVETLEGDWVPAPSSAARARASRAALRAVQRDPGLFDALFEQVEQRRTQINPV